MKDDDVVTGESAQAAKLVEALGYSVKDHVTAVTIEITATKPAVVRVARIVEEWQFTQVVDVLRSYRLMLDGEIEALHWAVQRARDHTIGEYGRERLLAMARSALEKFK